MELKCPHCNTKEKLKVDTYDYDEGEDCSLAWMECEECNTRFKVFFEEADEDYYDECPECMCDCYSFDDQVDDIVNKTVTYDAVCDCCGEWFEVQHTLNITKIEEVK